MTDTDATEFNPYLVAQAQFDRIAELMGLEPALRALLRRPQRELQVAIPVRMDDGAVRVFDGFRVLHNAARGPAKGGLRFHPLETVDTIRAMAMWMTWKTALVDLPLGGAMGGVVCEPHDLAHRELERICRGWVRQVAGDIGPEHDVPEPDVMTGSQHMAWILDEYEAIHRGHHPGAVTGKPVAGGGSAGRQQATGYGLVYILREALKEIDRRPDTTTASVQGFGTVARHAIELFHDIGGTVSCVATWDQAASTAHAFVKPDGIDVEELSGISDHFGGIDAERAAGLGYQVLPGDEWLGQDVDVLIPAALEHQITEEHLARVSPRVKIIAEGANGPTSPAAEAALIERGVHLVPDILANAGGVICSYFEQVQSNSNYYWDLAEVLGKLDVKLTSAYIEISELGRRKSLSLRDAALVIGIDRVAGMCRARGWV
jgi:glutamate dehydrogenase (NAD(P)+)